jgi:hypothetical protein
LGFYSACIRSILDAMAKGRKTGGRKRGTKNKRTVERERWREFEKQAQQDAKAVSEMVARLTGKASFGNGPPPAEGNGGAPVPQIRPLAKEELSDLIPIVKDILHRFLIAAFGEGNKGAPDQEHFDPVKWARVREWIKVYMDVCKSVAEYESPKFKPIEVTPAQAAVDEAERRGENEVTVVIRGGLPEPDAMVELDSEQALLKEMAAIQDWLGPRSAGAATRRARPSLMSCRSKPQP